MEKLVYKKINLNLNLSKEYKIIQISDLHMVFEDNEKEERWFLGKQHFSRLFNEQFDDYFNHTSSRDIGKMIIKDINKKDCNLVILSGDMIDYYCEENYDILKELIASIKHKTLYICGNHEGDCHNYLELMTNDPEFQVIDLEEFYVVGIDNSNKTFTNYQVNRLRKLLKDNKKIILVCHIPIILKSECNDDYFYVNYEKCDKDTKDFIDLIINNQNICGILSSHLHGYTYRLLKDDLPIITSSSALIGYLNEIIIK